MASSEDDHDAFSPPLDRVRHLKYWSRCLRSFLPHQYTSNDGNRIALAYFILSAIDLLATSSGQDSESDARDSPANLTAADRRNFREWILSCQHAGGGFCGSPSMTLPPHAYEGWSFDSCQPTMGNPGQANIAATVFALILLALLAADEREAEGAYAGVDRVRTLNWLRRLQREDGSFGEVLAEVEGQGMVVGGGRDMRYCYFAAMLRWVLRGHVRKGDAAWVEDIDVDALVRYIGRSRAYDKGIAESSQHEPHSGYAYCAISALSLLDRPMGPATRSDGSQKMPESNPYKSLHAAFPDIPSLIHWLTSRQFVYFDTPADDMEPVDLDTSNLPLSALAVSDGPYCVAFNGRCNKAADTCYCWWVCGALSILPPIRTSVTPGSLDKSNVDVLVSRGAARRFIFDEVQHTIGGFSKHPHGPPDMYHSYLGLAALATLQEPSLKPFDAALTASVDTGAKIATARAAMIMRANTAASADSLANRLLDIGVEIRGERPAWLVTAGGESS